MPVAGNSLIRTGRDNLIGPWSGQCLSMSSSLCAESQRGSTALILAAGQDSACEGCNDLGHFKTVESLLSAGVDIDFATRDEDVGVVKEAMGPSSKL